MSGLCSWLTDYDQIDFIDWMSFLPSNHTAEIILNPKDLSINT